VLKFTKGKCSHISDSVGLEYNLRPCISKKFPSDASICSCNPVQGLSFKNNLKKIDWKIKSPAFFTFHVLSNNNEGKEKKNKYNEVHLHNSDGTETEIL
jgi:hypothetical protein